MWRKLFSSVTCLLFCFTTRATAIASLVSGKKVCIAGAGPCGLFLAGLLLQEDSSVQVEIMEKAPRQGIPGQAFGIGLSPRLRRTLDAVHGLRSRVEAVGEEVNGLNGTLIAQRQDICEKMTSFIEEQFPGRCKFHFEEGCKQVNVMEQNVVSTKGNMYRYDVLVGADGINSVVRQHAKNIRVMDHYVLTVLWKALSLPPQRHMERDSFQPFKHPNFTGRILPRHRPKGHIALFFWDANGKDNPNGIDTVQDLEESFTEALQGKQRTNLFRRMLGMTAVKDVNESEVAFDQEALQLCFDGRAGISHYLKLDRYNDGVVSLLGDSAHGMYNLLGQGCACGLENAVVLGKSLTSSNRYETVQDALLAYSDATVPESHAITDLNLIAHAMKSNIFVKAMAFPPIMWSAFRGKMLFKRVNDDVPYTQVLKENRFVIWLSRRMWKRQREPATRA